MFVKLIVIVKKAFKDAVILFMHYKVAFFKGAAIRSILCIMFEVRRVKGLMASS